MPLPLNIRLGRYEIRALLGAGGMGEVYLAQDTELGRAVALKVLPAEVASNQERLRRFVQEARAASALNHPNILTIYESGRADATHFIATEFVDGETLRRRLAGAHLKLIEALDIVIQTADALSAAHEADIVHRDIKPENIMLRRRDGYVKVLDFGLAKLSEPTAEAAADAPTRPLVNTKSGAVMGTSHYMSPEQARGLEVDARTDIWSLGVVLYELVTGRSPFEGPTHGDIIANIIDREPPPLARFTRDAPEALEWIISKALARDRDERYQTARELLVDLRKLRRRLEFDTEQERSAPPASGAVTKTTLLVDVESQAAQSSDTAQTAGAEAARSTSSAEHLLTKPKRDRWRAAVVLAVLALIVTGVGYGVYRLLRPKQTALSFQTAKFARLTSTGKAEGAAISPDGKWLVHVQDDGGQQSLWLRQVAVPNSNTQIVPPAEVVYWGVAFSPDGNYIYYTASEKDAPTATSLYQTPVLGGATRKLTTGVNSPVAFSPDSKQLAFLSVFNGDEDKLMIANADGTGVRELAGRRGNEFFFLSVFSGVSWSPDGKTVATPVGNHVDNYMSVAAVSVASGEVKLLTPRRWKLVYQVAWLGDGSRLLVAAQEQGSETFNIWQLSYQTGEAQKLTNDLNSYPFFSLTADAGLVAAVQNERTSNLWVLPAFDAAQAKPVTQGRNYVRQPFWTPDGRILYSSNTGGNHDLYAIDARGGEPQQLTTGSNSDSYPVVSPDGRSVVFSSDRAGRLSLWRMDIDGANAKQLIEQTHIYSSPSPSSLSPDGRWVLYTSCANSCTSWKVAFDGGQPQQITEKSVTAPMVSPDGKQIACIYREVANVAPFQPAILSFADGQLIKTFAPPAGLATGPRWTADGRALIYATTLRGVSNLWAQPVDGGPPKQLTNFTAEQIFGFDISRDGRQLALSRGTWSSDVVLISDFK